MNTRSTRTPRRRAAWLMMAAPLAVGVAHAQPASPVPTTDGPWELVWHDEFDAPSLDTATWRVVDAFLAVNKELQYYTPEALSIRDGSLVITSEHRETHGHAYTSGRLSTRGTFYQAFGRFEARMKLPRGRGVWPAFWMLPEDGRWPPEIDIMENLGHDTSTVYTTFHFGVLPDHQHRGTPVKPGPDFADGFHVYRADWTPDRIEWFIDGVSVFTHDKDVPQDPFYVLLNTAVGGDWPGNPDAATTFPQETLVDYVRAYRKTDADYAYLSIRQNDGGRVLSDSNRWAFPLKGGPAPQAAAKIHLRALPTPGFRLRGWRGDASGMENPLTLDMTRNRAVEAVFEKDPNGPVLLSHGKPVTASSTEPDEFRPSLINDGKLGTRWSSAFKDGEWIEIDLESVRHVRAIVLRWEASYAKSYSVEISNDGRAWTPLLAKDDATGGTEQFDALDANARYVRLTGKVRAATFGTSLWEFEIYGD